MTIEILKSAMHWKADLETSGGTRMFIEYLCDDLEQYVVATTDCM